MARCDNVLPPVGCRATRGDIHPHHRWRKTDGVRAAGNGVAVPAAFKSPTTMGNGKAAALWPGGGENSGDGLYGLRADICCLIAGVVGILREGARTHAGGVHLSPGSTPISTFFYLDGVALLAAAAF